MTAMDGQGRLPRALALPALLLVTALAFLPVLDNGFTNWDDPAYLTDNPAVQRFVGGDLARLLTTFQSGNYHPLTMLALAAEHRAFGGDPRGYHAVSLALHLANTSLAFAVLLRLLPGATAAAGAAALLFGVHPLHVEPVAWVAEQKELLSTLLFLAALAAYLRPVPEGRRTRRLAAVLALFLLALLAKPMAVTFPLVMLLCDWFTGRGVGRRELREKWPFLLLSVAFAAVAIAGQQSAGAIRPAGDAAVVRQLLVACHGVVFYVAKFLVPLGLSALYPYPAGTGWRLPPAYLASPFLLAALAAAVAAAGRRARAVPFGALFALVTLAPVLQLVPTGSMVAADRYFYLPSLGLCFLVGAGLARLDALPGRAARRAGWAAFAAAAAACAWLTFGRAQVWRESLTLWDDVVSRSPDLALAWNNRGNARADRGEHDLALADFDRALRLDPGLAQAHYSRGNSLAARGLWREAIASYSVALGLEPRHARARHNRALASLELGAFAAAAEDARAAAALAPGEAGSHASLGVALAGLERFAEAEAAYREALRLDPSAADAWTNLGTALSALGRPAEAVDAHRRAVALAPGSVAPRYNLALDLARQGRRGEAEQQLRAALRADPGNARVRDALAALSGGGERPPPPPAVP